MSPVIIAIIVLGTTGIAGAVILYAVAKKFYVNEDPRIALIEELLPGANCGDAGVPDAMISHVHVRRPHHLTTSYAPERERKS